ncbi:MAG: zinc-binding dehydrogenase, partial [Luminiphilus sp.]|nr:zinc-binding dehydrogenase [Luminiphilus sp.]
GGAVGSIAGQLAKKTGARVVGLVGSADKGQWICDVLGYDAAVVRGDSDSLVGAIKTACPNGVDVFFDNVGGATLEAAISNMNHRGRMALCGAVSGYGVPAYGPSNLFEIVTKELKVEGFMTHFRHDRYDEAREALSEGLRSGVLVTPEYRLQGVDQIGQAYADLFAGRNYGKTVVEL